LACAGDGLSTREMHVQFLQHEQEEIRYHRIGLGTALIHNDIDPGAHLALAEVCTKNYYSEYGDEWVVLYKYNPIKQWNKHRFVVRTCATKDSSLDS
jgi:hypothetical protein